jgi:hypothetical protein
MRQLLLGVVALASAGCPDSLSLRCPANSLPSGSYGLVLTLQHTPDECVQIKQADGGPPPPDGSLVPATQGPQQSILCAGTSDAGPALYLVAGSGAVRQTPFDPDGGFTFVSPTVVQTQTVCNCVADLNETITGTLLGAGDAGFALDPDGGLVPQPTGISGSVVQVLTSDAGDCICSLGPGRTCAEHFTLTGTPNR